MRERICRVVLLSLGAAVGVYAVVKSFTINFNIGLFLTYVVALFLVLYGALLFCIRKYIPRALRALVWSVFVIVMLFMTSLFVFGSSDSVTWEEDVVIVLGAGVRGEEPGDALTTRLEAALEYHSKNPDAVIIVSGGRGPQEQISEALAMERYLVARGVPEEKIIREERSTSTRENLMFSKEILDEMFLGDYSVAVITNDFHVYRAKDVAEEIFGREITSFHADTPWHGVLVNGLRECVGVVKLWFIDRR